MRIAVPVLKLAGEALLRSLGATSEEAQLVTDSLVRADMRGIPTHGVKFLPLLAERVQHGMLQLPTRLKVLADNGGVVHLDGGNGLGQVAAAEGMRRCIAKARQWGVSLALIRNTNHIGFLAYYPLMAAAEGMIGICACNAAPAMGPWGGAEPFFGTNPFSIAAPAHPDPPIALDMSTSVVARGKMRSAAVKSQPIPLGWALDETGKPTTDAAAALKGTLLPIAGPKGYGLALFIDLLCGLLSGSKYGRELLSFHEPVGATGVGALVAAIGIGHFMPIERYQTLIRNHAESIRNSRKAAGCDRIYLPGDIEAEKERASQERVELDAATVRAINQWLASENLAFRLEEELPCATS